MAKVYVSKKQRNLLIRSATIQQKEFNTLHQYLKYHEIIKHSDIKRDQKLENLTSYLDELLKSCQSEWSPSPTKPVFDAGPDYKKFKIECDLCGHKYLKLQYRIINQLTKKHLVIGSECIKEFGDKLAGSFGTNPKEIRRAANRKYLEEKFPGIRKYVESYNQIHKYGMVIPMHLVVKWREWKEQLYIAYNDYISGNKKDLVNVEGQWIVKQRIEKEINQYVQQNKNKQYAVTTDLQEWILKNQAEEFMRQLQRDGGFLTSKTIIQVHEPKLMLDNLQNLMPHLDKLGIQIKNLNNKSKQVHVIFKKNKRSLSGLIRYHQLMQYTSGLLFSEPVQKANFTDLLDIAVITGQNSIDYITNWIISNLEVKHFKLVEDGQDGEIENDIILELNELYYRFNKKEAAQQNKQLYFKNTNNNKDKKKLVNKLYTWITSDSSKIMTKEQYTNFRQLKSITNKF